MIVQWRAVLANLVSLFGYGAFLFYLFPNGEHYLSQMGEPQGALIALALASPWVAFESLVTPLFSGVRLIKEGESADFPLADRDTGGI